MAIEEDPPPAIPEWVVTFGDMMSLLLTFFIMLVSMSEIKQEKRVQALVESLRQQFGDHDSRVTLGPGTGQPRHGPRPQPKERDYERRPGRKKGGTNTEGSPGTHSLVRNIRPGEQVLVGGVVQFPADSAQLTDEDKTQLETIVQSIQGKPQKIEIRGHTWKKPPGDDSEYKDNWDLAYARCRNVMKYLIDSGIDPKRIRVSVAAGNEPNRLGGDPSNQAENSRVEIYMLSETTEDLEGTPEDQAQRYATPVDN